MRGFFLLLRALFDQRQRIVSCEAHSFPDQASTWLLILIFAPQAARSAGLFIDLVYSGKTMTTSYFLLGLLAVAASPWSGDYLKAFLNVPYGFLALILLASLSFAMSLHPDF